MSAKVIGISGSPVKDSNTDRLIKAILDSSGQESEFIKLSSIKVGPCRACKQCVSDNVCKVGDDFPGLAEKIKNAKALIIGGYIPYGQIDAFTKALLERFWSLRHVNNLLQGKLCATVLTGVMPDALESANKSFGAELRDYERMILVGQITVKGNIPCLTCGKGDECEMSGVKMMYGPDARTADFGYSRVESQEDVWDEAARIGHLIGEQMQCCR
jgi:hypothetical protein